MNIFQTLSKLNDSINEEGSGAKIIEIYIETTATAVNNKDSKDVCLPAKTVISNSGMMDNLELCTNHVVYPNNTTVDSEQKKFQTQCES